MVYIKSGGYVVKTYLQESGKAPFAEWQQKLDGAVRARINARIARFEDGYFGDYKSVGDKVLEARFFFGAGYRVYFSILNNEIVLLLAGGDKSTQTGDIKLAKEFLKSYMEELNANEK
jgi:putative addiction module killer protein